MQRRKQQYLLRKEGMRVCYLSYVSLLYDLSDSAVGKTSSPLHWNWHYPLNLLCKFPPDTMWLVGFWKIYIYQKSNCFLFTLVFFVHRETREGSGYICKSVRWKSLCVFRGLGWDQSQNPGSETHLVGYCRKNGPKAEWGCSGGKTPSSRTRMTKECRTGWGWIFFFNLGAFKGQRCGSGGRARRSRLLGTFIHALTHVARHAQRVRTLAASHHVVFDGAIAARLCWYFSSVQSLQTWVYKLSHM